MSTTAPQEEKNQNDEEKLSLQEVTAPIPVHTDRFGTTFRLLIAAMGVVAVLIMLSVGVHELVQFLKRTMKQELYFRSVTLKMVPIVDAYVFLEDGELVSALDQQAETTVLSVPKDKKFLSIRSSRIPGEKTELFCRLKLALDGDTAAQATFRRAGITWVRNSGDPIFDSERFLVDSIDGQLFAPSDNTYNKDFMMCDESEHVLVLRTPDLQCIGKCRIHKDSPDCVVRLSELKPSCVRQGGNSNQVSSDITK